MSGYYAWRRRMPSRHQQVDEALRWRFSTRLWPDAASMAVRGCMRSCATTGSAAAANGSRGSCGRRGCVRHGSAGASRARPTASIPIPHRAQSVGAEFCRHGAQSHMGGGYHGHRDPRGVALPLGHCGYLFALGPLAMPWIRGGMRRWWRRPWRWRCAAAGPRPGWCTTPTAAVNIRAGAIEPSWRARGLCSV